VEAVLMGCFAATSKLQSTHFCCILYFVVILEEATNGHRMASRAGNQTSPSALFWSASNKRHSENKNILT